MSDAAQPLSDDAMLARIAARDLSGAEEAHDRMMRAASAAEFADYGRTYQRFARSLRQTLAIKARLAREASAAERERLMGEARRAARCNDLRGRLDPGLRIFTEPHEREGAFEALEREIETEAERPDFLEADLDGLLAGICARLPLDEPQAAGVERVGWAVAEDLWPDIPDPPPSADLAPAPPPGADTS
ncbi:MAG: hypothetical protein KIS90_17020 [Phenylobacterium sp.]|nr:hypothetical protein [Phenylobacterium sp.]